MNHTEKDVSESIERLNQFVDEVKTINNRIAEITEELEQLNARKRELVPTFRSSGLIANEKLLLRTLISPNFTAFFGGRGRDVKIVGVDDKWIYISFGLNYVHLDSLTKFKVENGRRERSRDPKDSLENWQDAISFWNARPDYQNYQKLEDKLSLKLEEI